MDAPGRHTNDSNCQAGGAQTCADVQLTTDERLRWSMARIGLGVPVLAACREGGALD